MAFQSRRAAAVFWKDFLDLRKNRGLMWTLLVFPAILVMVPAGIVFAYVRDATDASLRTMALFYDPNFPPGASAARYLIDRTLTDWFGLYLLMPVFVPILISSQSVAGEKEKRSSRSWLPRSAPPKSLSARAWLRWCRRQWSAWLPSSSSAVWWTRLRGAYSRSRCCPTGCGCSEFWW